jgi:hypothetical protein
MVLSRRALTLAGVVVLSFVFGVIGAFVDVRLGFFSPSWIWAARADANVIGDRVRVQSRTGDFEFEHSNAQPVSTFRAYNIGTGTRTPIQIGDSANKPITQLIVAGKKGQASPLQAWNASGKQVAAIDSRGRLVLGRITISAVVRHGRVVLIAVLPNGSQQVLATAR